MKIRVGLLGAGAWGRENHLPALAYLRFASGMAGEMRILPCSGSSTERIEVHSQRRSLYLRAGLLYGAIDPPGSIEIHEGGRLVERIMGDEAMPRVVSGGFVGEYLDLFRAMRDGTPTRTIFHS